MFKTGFSFWMHYLLFVPEFCPEIMFYCLLLLLLLLAY
jgi:hypothetical protein